MGSKPLLIVVNGLPGSGKTTLARQLAADMRFPVFSRDELYETLYDALECDRTGLAPVIGPAAYALLYHVAGLVLAAGQSAIIEGFFGRPELRSAELLQLRRAHDFAPFQILCQAEGEVLLERFLARARSRERHAGHQDKEWLAHNRERLLRGQLAPLAIGGQLVEVDTTTPGRFEYTRLLQRVQAAR